MKKYIRTAKTAKHIKIVYPSDEDKTMNTTTKHRGRPRIGEALRVPLTFSVDPEVRSMAQNLRNTGYPLNELIRLTICEAFEEQAQTVRDKEAGTL